MAEIVCSKMNENYGFKLQPIRIEDIKIMILKLSVDWTPASDFKVKVESLQPVQEAGSYWDSK